MTAIAISGFRGEVPRVSARLLPNNFAQSCSNARLTSGMLEPLRGPAVAYESAMTRAIRTMAQYEVADGSLFWLTWAELTRVAASPGAQDEWSRIYWAGDGGPAMTGSDVATDGAGPYPVAWFTLGVTAPASGMTLAPAAGGTTQTRAYITRFVTPYGEASGPSPAVSGDGDQAGVWELANLPAPPLNAGAIVGATVIGNVCTIELGGVNPSYGMEAGERLVVAGTAGITGLNGTHKIIKVVDATHVRIKLTASGVAAGGTWARENPHHLAGMKRQIFRTSGTGTDYYFVAEIDATADAYSDAVPSTALGEVCDSLATRTPPKNAHSIVIMANGAAAVLHDNEVCISEPGKPHSFPTASRYAVPGKCLDIIAVQNSIIVLTDAFPWLLTAEEPTAASRSKMNDYAPCLSKEGVVEVAGGCVFPSKDGYYVATPSGARNLTGAVFRQREFAALNPESMRGVFHDQQLYVTHAGPNGRVMFSFDMSAADSIVRINYDADSMYVKEGTLFVSRGGTIYEWDANDSNRLLAFFRSKEYQFGPPLNFAVAQVFAQFDDLATPSSEVAARNAELLTNARKPDGALCSCPVNTHAINGSAIRRNATSAARKVQFSLRRKNALVFSKLISTTAPFRLPGGFKDELYSVEISSSVPVESVTLATSIQALQAVGQ